MSKLMSGFLEHKIPKVNLKKKKRRRKKKGPGGNVRFIQEGSLMGYIC